MMLSEKNTASKSVKMIKINRYENAISSNRFKTSRFVLIKAQISSGLSRRIILITPVIQRIQVNQLQGPWHIHAEF